MPTAMLLLLLDPASYAADGSDAYLTTCLLYLSVFNCCQPLKERSRPYEAGNEKCDTVTQFSQASSKLPTHNLKSHHN